MVSTEITDTQQESIYDAIRQAGGRLTVPMRIVVAIVLDGDGHPTADDIIAEANRRIPGIAPSTIYRVLGRLDELNIIEHVHAGTGAAFYQLKASSHVHLVCNECGAIINIPEKLFTQLSKNIRNRYQFEIAPRHAAIMGRCAACLTRNSADPEHLHANSAHHHHHHHHHDGY